MKIERNFPGVSFFKDGVRMVPVEAIPGVLETGWMPNARYTRNSRITEETTDIEILNKQLKKVLNFVSLCCLFKF